VRLVNRGDADHSAVLHLALGARPPGRTHQMDSMVTDLLADGRDRGLSLDLLFGAFRGSTCLTAALAIESPGHAALLMAPQRGVARGYRAATTACLNALRQAAGKRSIVLQEMLIPTDSQELAEAAAGSGFRFLTRLLYLRRPSDTTIPLRAPRAEPHWVPFTDSRADFFAEAIQRTYAQSLDCPELTGLRPMPDVLAGHRAAGPFDPALWSVAMLHAQPVAVLLLSRHARQETVEMVYMGVAQVARGTGVADAVMRRALEAAGQVGANMLALAVDRRNIPARKLYAAWGFTQFAACDAWIVTSPPTEG